MTVRESSLDAHPVNASWKLVVAAVAVALLSVPSAVGVYGALAPTRGVWAAGAAAIGFELSYLSLSLLVLRADLRAHARMVALGAVLTAITLNVVSDYIARVPGGLARWADAVARFDPLAVVLAVVESAPMAGLAFALASLLHRLAEVPSAPEGEHTPPPPATRETVELPDVPAWGNPRSAAELPATWARIEAQTTYHAPELVNTEGVRSNTSNALSTTPARIYGCRYCGATGLSKAEQLTHGRQQARERREAADGDRDTPAP